VFKYQVEALPTAQTLNVPIGTKFIHLALDPSGALCVWAIVEEDAPLMDVVVFIVGTGNKIPENTVHVASCIDQFWVWHLFCDRTLAK